MDFAAATQFAALLHCGQELRRKTKHARSDRAALRFIGVQQDIGRAGQDRRQFPTQIVCVLYTGIETLTARWGVNVRRISRQENSSNSIAIGQTCIHIVG
jgi:hypothetical protein